MSGGNQQKVALMKWLVSGSDVQLLDEPTRGVDVGAKVEIYRVINELAAKGAAVVVVSSEMIELIGLCDRVLVMREGRQMAILPHETATQHSIMALATGQKDAA